MGTDERIYYSSYANAQGQWGQPALTPPDFLTFAGPGLTNHNGKLYMAWGRSRVHVSVILICRHYLLAFSFVTSFRTSLVYLTIFSARWYCSRTLDISRRRYKIDYIFDYLCSLCPNNVFVFSQSWLDR